MSALDGYWARYDHTLAVIRAERPSSFATLKVILDRFESPSSGDAFFPGGADDDLASALADAGWDLTWEDGDYVWSARHPLSGAVLRYVEGDVYCLKEAPHPGEGQ